MDLPLGLVEEMNEVLVDEARRLRRAEARAKARR
jgi:hypothetical protein